MAFGDKGKRPNQQRNDNTNRGIIYESDRKRTEKSPDYWGFINVDGRDYKFSGWIGEDSKGRDCMKVAVKPKTDDRRNDYDHNGRRDDRAPYDRGDDEPPFPGDQERR